jgi:hypothetical protein
MSVAQKIYLCILKKGDRCTGVVSRYTRSSFLMLFIISVCSFYLIHVSISSPSSLASLSTIIPSAVVIASTTNNGQGEDDGRNNNEFTSKDEDVEDVKENQGGNSRDDDDIDLDEINLLQICCAWSDKISDGVLEYRIIDEVDDNTKQSVRNAIQDWDILINNLIFVEKQDDSEADVEIVFSDSDEDANDEEFEYGDSIAAGKTEFRFDNRGFIDSVDVTLSGGIFGNQFHNSALEQTARHEIGHVLGLGHANFAGSLMSTSTESGNENISVCEINGVLVANHWKLVSGGGGDDTEDGPEHPKANFVVC